MNGTNESFLLNEVPLFARRRRRPNKIVRSFLEEEEVSRALSLSLSLSREARALAFFWSALLYRLSLFFPLSPYNLSSYNTLNITLASSPPLSLNTHIFFFFFLSLSFSHY